MKHTRCLSAAPAIASLFLFTASLSSPRAFASDSSAMLSQAQMQDMVGALKTLSARTHTPFLVEGSPCKPHLDPEAVPHLDSKDDPDQILVKLARAYDYDVIEFTDAPPEESGDSQSDSAKPRCYLLQKRYSDPRDLPCVPLEEYVATLEDIRKLLAPYGPQPPLTTNTALIRGIANSFTPEQRQAITGQGLPVAALTDSQKQQIERLVLDGYIGVQLRKYDEILPILEQAKQITLGDHSFSGSVTFGYWFRDSLERSTFWPLMPPHLQTQEASDTAGTRSTTSADSAKQSPRAPLWPADQTLAAAIEGLNARLTTTAPASPGRIEVEPSLDAKPIRIIGAEYAPPLTTLKAIARLYDLRISYLDTRYRLERRRRFATDLPHLPDALYHTLPDPLLRAMHVSWRAETNKGSVFQRDHQQYLDFDAHSSSLTQSAAIYVQSAVSARLQTAPSPRVDATIALASLDPPTQSAFALCVSRELLAMMNTQFGDNAPPVTLHWGEGVLHGGEYKVGDRRKYGLTVVYTWENPDGTKQTNTAGVVGLDYPFRSLE